jgi:Flp pilus assembly CpaE family ATPase
MHSSRLLNECIRLGIRPEAISVVVNRSGSKFKEAVSARDFERVSGHPINFYVPNDIKTVVKAESKGCTLVELGHSSVANQIEQLADTVATKISAARTSGGKAFKTPTDVYISAQETKRLT